MSVSDLYCLKTRKKSGRHFQAKMTQVCPFAGAQYEKWANAYFWVNPAIPQPGCSPKCSLRVVLTATCT